MTPPFLAHDVAIASNYGPVWVTSGDRGRIAIYRLNGAKLIGQIAAAASPQHVAFVAGRAFVAAATTARQACKRDRECVHGNSVPIAAVQANRQSAYPRIYADSRPASRDRR